MRLRRFGGRDTSASLVDASRPDLERVLPSAVRLILGPRALRPALAPLKRSHARPGGLIPLCREDGRQWR